ncbi:MAG: hypothetical protein LBR11_04815 [Deltaproteobacteria bacterium]|jgi:hypothetical protein|nr:hypothetical protein [Deltaproteobacteria bacterium]
MSPDSLPQGQIVALVDLDDTLFQTLSKCPEPGECLTVAAMDRQGQPLSFMRPSQRLLWELLEKALVIPVTARNREAYGRVNLRFQGGAILSFGGVILNPDGQEDPGWRKIIEPQARAASDFLKAAQAKAQTLIQRDGFLARARIIEDQGLPFYVVIKTQPDNLHELALLAMDLRKFSRVAKVYLNGNNLAILPQYLDKAPAASYFLANQVPPAGERLCLTIGDSRSDLGFLALGDFQVIPTRSQLSLLWRKKKP